MLSLPLGSDLAWKVSTRSHLFFFCNISITLNYIKLEKQFSSDCSQAILKSCTTLQSNVLENISLLKKLFQMLIWGRKVIGGMKICYNCVTWDYNDATESCKSVLSNLALFWALKSCTLQLKDFLPAVFKNRSCWENDADVAKLKNLGTKRYCCVNNYIASDLLWFAVMFEDASKTWKQWAFFSFWKLSYPYITPELL